MTCFGKIGCYPSSGSQKDGAAQLHLKPNREITSRKECITPAALQAIYLFLHARSTALGFSKSEITLEEEDCMALNVLPSLLFDIGFSQSSQGLFSQDCAFDDRKTILFALELVSEEKSLPGTKSSSRLKLLKQEKDGTFKLQPRDEIIAWVNSRGETICCLPRSVVHSLNLLHRGAGILVKNDKGLIYVHQRTATKRIFPSMFDMFIGGVALPGESNEQTARREIQEELGIGHDQSIPLTHMFDSLVLTAYNRCFVNVFQYTSQKEETILWQPEEVAWGSFLEESKILGMISEGKSFVPDGMAVWQDYIDFRA